MNVLTKLASENSSRLEKIASAIAAIEEGYDPEEVIAFAAEQGIAPEEVVLGTNLFASDLGKEASYEDELQKIASVIADEYTVPLVKVAAAVDLFAAGALEADDVYGIAGDFGFSQDDVDYIFTSAYPDLAKEAGASESGEKLTERAWKKIRELGTGMKNAAMAKELREGLKADASGKRDYLKALKGAGKTGAIYGIPAGAAAYLATRGRDGQED